MPNQPVNTRRLFMLILFCLMLIITGQAAAQTGQTGQMQTHQATFDSLGYGDLPLQGLYASSYLYVPFQSNWALQDDALMMLRYMASPLLLSERSTLTILANNVEVHSLRPVPGALQQVQFTIPLDRLQGQGVTLQFRAYNRLTEQLCEETNNPAQWLTILADSQISFDHRDSEATASLPLIADQLLVRGPLEESPPVRFVLPDAPDQRMLTTAAHVAARLSHEIGGVYPVEVVSESALTAAQREESNLVLIGLKPSSPLLQDIAADLPLAMDEGLFLTVDGEAVPAGHALVQAFNAPWNPARYILLVSANDEAGLSLAGQVFQDRAVYRQLQGEFAFISALNPLPDVQAASPWLQDVTSFAQLGDRDRLVSGFGITDETYYFSKPIGWLFDTGSALQLQIAASPVLRPQESYFAVFINDVFVGSQRIGGDIPAQPLRFELPVGEINQALQRDTAGLIVLRIQIANRIEEGACTPADPNVAWTRISASSAFLTRRVYQGLPDLRAFPYPFVDNLANTATIIALPDAATDEELSYGIGLAALMGRYAADDVSLTLMSASELNPEAHAGSHLILIGERQRLPLIDEFLAQMAPVPDDAIYKSLSRPETGLLREAPSPWNSDRLALLVFSDGAVGLRQAMQAMLAQLPIVSESATVAAAYPGEALQVIYRSAEVQPDVTPQLIVREQQLPAPEPWVVVTVLMVIALAIVAMIVLFSQSRRA